ncbi:MAG: DinB family protein [Pyrinomonadaceae bacterium]
MLKETLLHQFGVCYDQNEWFVAIKNAVDGLTAEEAAWKPAGTEHSIWELVNHLSHDNNSLLHRVLGVEYGSPAANNDETFFSPSGSWAADLERFEAIMTRWRDLLEIIDDAKLAERVPPRNELAEIEIANMNAHNAYHGGQILLIRKLQGAWDPQNGVS